MKWIKYEGDDCYAIVTYNYLPVNTHHMELKIGDYVYIKEQYPGWYRGFKYSQPCVLKVFPNTHVKILNCEIHPDLWAEIFSWIPNIKDAYLFTENKEFNQVCETVQLTLEEKRFDNLQERSRVSDANRRLLVTRMDAARKLLCLPIETRNEKLEKLDLKTVSTLELYNQHNKVTDNNRNIPGQFDSTTENLSIFVKMLNIYFEKTLAIDENFDVIISLYKLEDKTRLTRFSESYTYRVGMRMSQCDLVKTSPIVTKDIQFASNQKIFLVFQFIRIGQMLVKITKKPKEADTQYRRPQGVAVLDISGVFNEPQDTTRKIGIQLMQKEESIETITERLIQDYRNNRGEYRSTIEIMFKAMRPDEFTDRYIMLYGMNPYYPPSIRSKRNCLYLTLHKADINRGDKKSDPNFEVDVSIRDESGNLVAMPRDDWRFIEMYKSVIYYHIGKPKWNELICIPLFDKMEKFPPQTHIRFVIWHRSLNDRGKSPYGVAHLKLFPNLDSYAIIGNKDHDNSHVLTIHKSHMDDIKTAKYLQLPDEVDDNLDNISTSMQSSATITERMKNIGKKKKNLLRDTLYVQTLLISNEYTFDELLANVCSNRSIDPSIMTNLYNQEILVKNIDVDELKKFSIKILESSLDLLQKANDKNLLGRNILILLGEMFKAIKNLPDYQIQMDKFIYETMHFKVHKQILHELINHVPEIESNTLRASDWFMKIVVKSYQNLQSEFLGNNDDKVLFNQMVDQYLLKLEFWANRKDNMILRKLVLSKAGPIINALIPVCQTIGMAKLVHNLLASSHDLDAFTKVTLTMESMRSRLFLEPECRQIILPETTRNILESFNTQLKKIYQGREVDQDHMLDNICDNMIEFMQLHEKSWQKVSTDMVDRLVYELLIEHNMLRSCISIMSMGLENLRPDDAACKLLYKPLMVLVTVIITCLGYLSTNLWEKLLAKQIGLCSYCSSKQMTNNYDMVMELLGLIMNLQLNPVFPYLTKTDEENHRLSNSYKMFTGASEVTSRQHRVIKQPWLDMFFVQSKQFLATIGQIHRIIVRPYYMNNIIAMKKSKHGSVCCCHPSEKLQCKLINLSVECVEEIISQPYLKLELLPPSSSLRMMQNSKEWDYDIRKSGALLIKEIWHDLGLLKINFSSFFFMKFSKLTTIQNYKIRLLAVECMFDIVHLDHAKMKTELITQIDEAMEKADASYSEEMGKAMKQELSNNGLQHPEDVQLVENIMVQMSNIQECSQHLNDNSPINGMIVINNLRKFYQKMGRSDIIGRYLFKLIAIHSKIKNFTEIGYTLLELSSFYNWTHDLVRDTFFPEEYTECEFEWQLKAQLLEKSLTFFEQEDWEQGIEVCNELINGYSNYLVDFVKLSEVHKKMSELLRKIMYEDRPEPSAYIIFYVGLGFPKFITELPQKSIVLITKRNPNEMSMDLNSQFKNTTVEKRFPSDTEHTSGEKKIFFMPIKSDRFVIPPKYDGKPVKQRIRKYYENFKIDEFVFKRLINSTEEDPKKRKIEGCVIKCDGRLPNILSVVPVKALIRESIDPFNEALHDLQNQIRKDEMLYQDYEMASPSKRETMHQKMKDVIIKYISPVSGGVTKLVDMIPEKDQNKLSYAGDVVTQVFFLIVQYLQTFEIYDNSENFNIFLTEFRKVINSVTLRLDICEEDFNIKPLLEQFNKSRKETCVGNAIRKMSMATRTRHDEENQTTVGRKTKIPAEFLAALANDNRNSGTLDEEFQMVSVRSRSDANDPVPLPKRMSSLDSSAAAAPPIPPNPKFKINSSMLSNQQLEPPAKPSMVVCREGNLENHK